MESDFEATLAFEVPSLAGLDFFCLPDFEPSSLDESEEEFPL